MKSILIIKMLFFSFNCNAQTFDPNNLSHIKKRYSFAQMYFGLEGLKTANGSTFFKNSLNTLQSLPFSGYTIPRFTWGATHFWGHADIYLSFPLGAYKKTAPSPYSYLNYGLSVETGMKFYPSKIKNNKIKPYIGAAWNVSEFKQSLNDSSKASIVLTKNTTPILAGFSYKRKNMIFETGIQFYINNKYNYPINKNDYINLKLPKYALTLGCKILLETTKQKSELINKKIIALKKYKKFNSFYFGIGLSASIGIPTFSEFDKINYPFFKNHTRYFGVIPDFTFGYYFSNLNLNIGLSKRNMADSYEGFGVQHYHKRKSLMFEVYKFLGDYHGFAPYLGITISKENLFFATKDYSLNNNWIEFSNTKPAVGIILGWDIKPTKAESWLLRTNLRYAPLSLKADNKKVTFDYIEFNFLQLIMFPERMLIQRKSKKIEVKNLNL